MFDLDSHTSQDQRNNSYFYEDQLLPRPPKEVQENRKDAGGLAQMVERSLSMREVVGSMPTSSNFYVALTPTQQLQWYTKGGTHVSLQTWVPLELKFPVYTFQSLESSLVV